MSPFRRTTMIPAAIIAALIIATVSQCIAAASPGRVRANSTIAHAQMEPAIAADGRNVYAVWQSNGSGEWQIMFAASRDGAKTFGRDICLSCAIPAIKNFTPIHHQPAIAAAPGGFVYILWQGITDDLDYDIFSAVSTNAGKTFSKPQRLNANKPGNQQFPSISATSTPGIALATWQDNRDNSSGWRIYTASIAKNGQNISGDIDVSRDAAGAMNVWSHALADNSGRNASVWQCENDICFTATDKNGGSFSNPKPQQVFAAAANRRLPAACFTSDGSLFIAWAGLTDKKLDLFGTLLINGKTDFTPPAALASETANYQTQPAVAALPGGSVAVAWTDTRQTGDLAIYFNTFSTDSGTIKPTGSERRIDPPSPVGFSEHPALAASSNGTVYLIYADDATGDYDIYVKIINSK